MNLEREYKVNYFAFWVSIFILFIGLSIFFYLKGAPTNPDTLERLSNLKSMVEENKFRHYTEPIPAIFLYFWKKTFHLTYIPAYESYLALVFSIFLHSIMLIYRQTTWKIINYFLIYSIAFIPLAFIPFLKNVVFDYSEEMLSLCFLMLMYPKLRLEKISDLFLCIFYISLAFLCKISFFLFAFTVFAVLASFRSMNEQKSRVTVFYKRKNIPGIILMIYLSFLFIILILITWFQYFGKDSFSYFIRETWDVVIHLLPIFVVLKAGDYLIRSEKELNALGTRLIVGTIILVAVVLSFRSQYESLDYLEKLRSEILSLQKRGKIQGNQNIYGSNLLSDYVYFYGGFAVRFREGSVQKPDDLFVISNIDPSVRQYLDKSHLKGQYFPVNGSTILITREASDTILFQEGKNILKSRLTQFLSGLPLVKPSPHQKFCSYLGENFGFEVSAN